MRYIHFDSFAAENLKCQFVVYKYRNPSCKQCKCAILVVDCYNILTSGQCYLFLMPFYFFVVVQQFTVFDSIVTSGDMFCYSARVSSNSNLVTVSYVFFNSFQVFWRQRRPHLWWCSKKWRRCYPLLLIHHPRGLSVDWKINTVGRLSSADHVRPWCGSEQKSKRPLRSLSRPAHVGPRRKGVQVKHCSAPSVDGQCDAQYADDVHDYSSPGLKDEKRLNRQDGRMN